MADDSKGDRTPLEEFNEMTAYACGGGRFDCSRRDDTAAGPTGSIRRVGSMWSHQRPHHWIRCVVRYATPALAVLVATAAVAIVHDRASGGGFESVLVEDASTATAGEGNFAIAPETYGGVPGSAVMPPAESHAVVGDETVWTAGDYLYDAWNSCTSAFGSLMPQACGHCGRGPAACCLAGCCSPRWCAQVDSLVLWQGNIPSTPFLTAPTGLVALNANQAQTQATPGIRVGLLRCLDECTSLEGNYLWAQPFQSYTLAPRTNGLYTMTNLAGLQFNDITMAAMRTEAQFQGAEFNWRHCDGGIFTWLSGFRWVQWNQTTAVSYGYAPAGGLPGGPGSTQSRVGNDLYGWQWGGLMRLWENGGRWQVKGLGKAGIFYNTAWQQTSVLDGRVPVPPNNPVRASGEQTSFVGELGLNSTYWFTDWMAWRLGYTFFWLTDVAVPQAQFPISNIGNQTAGINTTGSVLVHGLNTGFEVCW